MTILICFAFAAIMAARLAHTPDDEITNSAIPATGAVIYAASFPDLNGRSQLLGQWSNKLLIINIWASWCAPCLEEIPILLRLQEKYARKGLQIVGIAADSRLNSAKFAEKLKIVYPVLPDEINAIEFSKRVGNRFNLLPFTIAVNSRGEIIYAKFGVIDEVDFTKMIERNLTN